MNKRPASDAPDPFTTIRPSHLERRELAVLDPSLLGQSVDDGADRRGDRTTRHDGWTPEKIYTFLMTLADTGCVADAARAATMSVQSAYRLRNRVEGRAFNYAWEAALQIAKRQIADALIGRAVRGCVDVVTRNGVVVAERHRFDNRLSMAALTRLDQRLAADHDEAEAVRICVEEFDDFAGIVSKGGAGAAEFIYERRALGRGRGRAERLMERLDEPRSAPTGGAVPLDPFQG